MKHLTLLAAAATLICLVASARGFPVAKDIAAEIAQADPRSVLSSSSHHIPDNDDPLVSIFVDILHDGDGETDPEPWDGEKVEPKGTTVSPKEAMRKRKLAAALDDTGLDTSEDTSEESSEEERDNRIGKFVNIHVGIDNRGNGNGDGLVNVPM